MPLAFRESKESDINFIYATVIKSYRHLNPIAMMEPDREYKRNATRQWKRCIGSGAKIIIACDEEDPELIIGLIIYENRTIHFTYVRAAFRSAGIGKSLVERAGLKEPIEYSHWCLDIARLGLDEKYKLYYNPLLFNWE